MGAPPFGLASPSKPPALPVDSLLKEIKVLAAQLDVRQNDLLEEAIDDLLKKYKRQQSSVDVSYG
jgi:hypothetical protein